MVICTCNTLSGYFKTKNIKQQFSWHLCAEALNLSTKNKPSSQSPEGIVNHEFFLKKIELKQQASSYRQQAGGGGDADDERASSLDVGGWVPKGTSTRGGWAHSSQATYPQVIHRKDI